MTLPAVSVELNRIVRFCVVARELMLNASTSSPVSGKSTCGSTEWSSKDASMPLMVSLRIIISLLGGSASEVVADTGAGAGAGAGLIWGESAATAVAGCVAG